MLSFSIPCFILPHLVVGDIFLVHLSPPSVFVPWLTAVCIVFLVHWFGQGLWGCGQGLGAWGRKRSHNERLPLTPAPQPALQPLCLALLPPPCHPSLLHFTDSHPRPFHLVAHQPPFSTCRSFTSSLFIPLAAAVTLSLSPHSCFCSPGGPFYLGPPLSLLLPAQPGPLSGRQAARLPRSSRKLQQQGLGLYGAAGWLCQKSCQAKDERPLPVRYWGTK